MLSTLVESEDALRSVDRGRIGLATLRSVTAHLTAPSVAAFLADHPQVELTVEEGRHRDVAEWLHDRQIDLAVIGWPNFDPLLDAIEPLALIASRRCSSPQRNSPRVSAPSRRWSASSRSRRIS